jgi:hypothetical protein
VSLQYLTLRATINSVSSSTVTLLRVSRAEVGYLLRFPLVAAWDRSSLDNLSPPDLRLEHANLLAGEPQRSLGKSSAQAGASIEEVTTANRLRGQ